MAQTNPIMDFASISPPLGQKIGGKRKRTIERDVYDRGWWFHWLPIEGSMEGVLSVK